MKPTSKQSLDKSTVLRLLEQEKEFLAREYGVTRLALFGSVGRNDAGAESDVDILVKFDGPATSKRYFGVQFYLEDLLGCPIDLVTEKALWRTRSKVCLYNQTMRDSQYPAAPDDTHDHSLIKWFANLSPDQRLAELESRVAFFLSLRTTHGSQLPKDSGSTQQTRS